MGTRAYALVERGAAGPIYSFEYWPDGVGDYSGCEASLVGDESGECDIPLSERWTLHYEWVLALKKRPPIPCETGGQSDSP